MIPLHLSQNLVHGGVEDTPQVVHTGCTFSSLVASCHQSIPDFLCSAQSVVVAINKCVLLERHQSMDCSFKHQGTYIHIEPTNTVEMSKNIPPMIPRDLPTIILTVPVAHY